MAMPVYDNRFLEKKNVLFSDKNIDFQEVGHVYRCFNVHLDKWIESKKFCSDLGCDLESVTGILKPFFFDTYSMIAKRILKNARVYDPSDRYFGCKTVEDVKERWIGGSIEGTKMHAIFEDYANIFEQQREFFQDDRLTTAYMRKLVGYKEIRYLFEFMRKFRITEGTVRFFRTELRMYDPVLNVSGTIDVLLKDERDGEYIIIDYKRTPKIKVCDPKKLRTTNPTSFGGYLPSMKAIHNCGYNHYALQLNLYRYILYHVYGIRVKGMYLIIVNPTLIDDGQALEILKIPTGIYERAICELGDARAGMILNQGSAITPELKQKLEARRKSMLF